MNQLYLIPEETSSDMRLMGDVLTSLRNIEPVLEIVIPTYNEEDNIRTVLEEALLYADKILVIDGRSKDKTLEIAKEMVAETIIQEGKGKGAAIIEAFERVDGDIILLMDGDGSNRAEEIPKFLGKIYSGADMVKGSRFLGKGGSEDITMLRRFGNTVFVFLINLLYRTSYTDICYGYIALTREAARKLAPVLCSNGFNIETEMVIKAKKLGLRTVEVPSLELKRLFGRSKLNTVRDGAKILFTILKEKL